MLKAWFHTKLNQRGFSPVEVLLAATVFGMIITGVAGAIIYGRESTDTAGSEARATMLAEEANEAVRNIRDAAFGNLVDGTYGLVQSGNQWTLSGSSDTTGIYTRQVVIATGGGSRKTVTSRVSWTQGSSTRQVEVVSQLSNWLAATIKSWLNPTQEAGLDLTGTNTGVKVATSGNYAYVVRTDGSPDFVVVNITTPSAPTVVGSLSLSGTPTNVFISGNYAYVTSTDDAAELRVINVATPTAPSVTGTYNAAGASDGKDVFVSGTTAYLSRNANSTNDEFVLVNVGTPSAPTRLGGYSLNVNMNEVHIYGTVAYIATSSDTQEVLVLSLTLAPILSLGTSINLPGTTDATTITGSGLGSVQVGQGSVMYTLNTVTSLIPAVAGSVTLTGTINDLTYNATHNLTAAGTNNANGEFQLVNLANYTAPALYSSYNMTGSLSLTGVAYNSSKDRVVGVSNSTALETVVFAPN